MAKISLDEIRNRLNSELNPFERFTDLLTGKDDRQDLELVLLHAILEALVGEETEPGQEPSLGMQVTVPIGIEKIDIMKGIAALTTAEINPEKMADCRKALRIVLMVRNNFDQQVSVKIIGNDSSTHDGAFTIHTMNVAAGARGAYGIKLEEWNPYMGLTVTPAANPSAGGTVSASVIIQRQVAQNG